MRERRSATAVLIAVVLALVLGTGVTDAATGGRLLLGRVNHESSAAILQNDGSGTAAWFKVTAPGVPPIRVSNSTKVPSLNVDLLDGLSASAFQKPINGSCAGDTAGQSVAAGGGLTCSSSRLRYTHIVVIAGGMAPTDAAQAVRDTLAGITTATAESHWLIVLEPGVYDFGNEPLSLKEHIDISGAGPRLTRLIWVDQPVAVYGKGDTTMSHLAIEARRASGSFNIGYEILPAEAGHAELDDVIVDIDDNVGVYAVGLVIAGGDDLTFTAHRVTVDVYDGDGTTEALEVSAGGTTDFEDGSLSSAGGKSNNFAISLLTGTLHVARTMVDGPVNGTPNCVDDWNAAYAAVGASCT